MTNHCRGIVCVSNGADKLGTIDFVHPKQPYPVFRTCEGEQGHNCMQIGTSDAQRALKAASIV